MHEQTGIEQIRPLVRQTALAVVCFDLMPMIVGIGLLMYVVVLPCSRFIAKTVGFCEVSHINMTLHVQFLHNSSQTNNREYEQ